MAIPAVTRLPADDGFPELRLAPTPQAVQVVWATIAVRVQNLPSGWQTMAAGLAIHNPSLRHGMQWLPLDDAERRGGELVFDVRLPQDERFTFALAAERSLALHGYLVRKTQTVASRQDVVLDATAAAVEFLAADHRAHSGPWRLSRRGDPAWLPMSDGSAGITMTAAAPVRVWLGAGDYVLEDPIARHPPLPFSVPTDRRVVVTADRPPAPGAPR